MSFASKKFRIPYNFQFRENFRKIPKFLEIPENSRNSCFKVLVFGGEKCTDERGSLGMQTQSQRTKLFRVAVNESQLTEAKQNIRKTTSAAQRCEQKARSTN